MSTEIVSGNAMKGPFRAGGFHSMFTLVCDRKRVAIHPTAAL
jgi:hypothetical protein